MRMKTSCVTTKGDTTVNGCCYEDNNRRFHATWFRKCCTKYSRYFSVYRWWINANANEIDYERGYIANPLGQIGDIDRNVTFINFRWDIVAARCFSNFRHYKLSFVQYDAHQGDDTAAVCPSDCTSVRLLPCNACNCHYRALGRVWNKYFHRV